MDDDGVRGEVGHTISLVQQQMRELAVMQQKQTALTATGTAAEGMVEVSVDSRRVVTKTVIDESYLDEYEFGDLSGHITAAAQLAAQELERRSAAFLVPLTERRQEISSLAGRVAGVPNFTELLSGMSSFAADELRRGSDGVGNDMEEQSTYPTVRS